MITSPSEIKTWNETQGKLKQTFSVLKATDFEFEEGNKEKMLEKIQLKLGKTKEEFTAILTAL